MPVYQYEGQHFDLPDGLSNEQAIAKIESYLGKAAAPAQTEQPQEAQGRSLPQELARQVGLTGRAAYEAFTAPATAALEAGKSLYNVGAQLVGSSSRAPEFAKAQEQMLTSAGVPAPETTTERAAQAGAQAMGSTAGLAKLAPQVPALAANLAQQIPAAGAGAAAGQATAEQTKQFTGSDLAATLAGLGVGALAAGATGRVAGAMAAEKPNLMTMDEVKQRAQKAYTTMADQGVSVKPQSALNMVNSLRSRLDNAGYISENAPAIENMLKKYDSIIGTERVPFTTVEKFRSMATKLSSEAPTDDVKRLSREMVKGIDEYMAKLSGKDIIAGKEGLDSAVKNVMDARKDWRNLSRASVLEDALNVAEAKALDPKASESELIRRGFINIAANKDKMGQFSETEQNVIKSVAKGGSLDPLLSILGRFNPMRSHLAMGGEIMAASQNPYLAAGTAGTGLAADVAQGVLRKKAAEKAVKEIVSGATRPNPPNFAWRGLFQGGLNPPQGQ